MTGNENRSLNGSFDGALSVHDKHELTPSLLTSVVTTTTTRMLPDFS